MNKKGSMELSVNSIVILVIAIVMLGLILGFVRSKFADVDEQLSIAEPEAPTATPSDPLTISRESITASAGKKIALKVQVYNANEDTNGVPPAFTITGCINTDMVSDSNNDFNVVHSVINVPSGAVQKFTLIAKVPSLGKDKYICTLRATRIGAGNTDVQKELLLTIV